MTELVNWTACTTVYHSICKLSEDQKEKTNVLNRPENLTPDFVEDDLSPMPPLEGDEKLKFKPEETIAERLKLNPRKRKKSRNRFNNLDFKQPIN